MSLSQNNTTLPAHRGIRLSAHALINTKVVHCGHGNRIIPSRECCCDVSRTNTRGTILDLVRGDSDNAFVQRIRPMIALLREERSAVCSIVLAETVRISSTLIAIGNNRLKTSKGTVTRLNRRLVWARACVQHYCFGQLAEEWEK